MMREDAGRPTDPTSGEAGVSLLEVLVAMVIFGVVAASVSALATQSLATASNNERRVEAANLAANFIEEARAVSLDQLPDGSTTRQMEWGGRTYEVERNIGFVATGDKPQGICRVMLPAASFKQVEISVTWDDMGSTAPVRSATQRSLGLSETTANAVNGHVAARAVDENGEPLQGVEMVLDPAGRTAVTDANGCAVWRDVDASLDGVQHSVTATAPNGFVTEAGGTELTESGTAHPGKVTDLPEFVFWNNGATADPPPADDPVTTTTNVTFTGAMRGMAIPHLDRMVSGGNVMSIWYRTATVPNGVRLPECATVPAGARCSVNNSTLVHPPQWSSDALIDWELRNVPNDAEVFASYCTNNPGSYTTGIPVTSTGDIPFAPITVDFKHSLGWNIAEAELVIWAVCPGEASPRYLGDFGAFKSPNGYMPSYTRLPAGEYILGSRDIRATSVAASLGEVKATKRVKVTTMNAQNIVLTDGVYGH